ncbi:zinc-ribbon domain-containing protein [Pseudomonas putida]|uniref:zinc-ribbon domain-containing protein n=1 Tax=Pseudomonas putida TaxID=303 RepID=UPI002363AA5B|nr:zinc-ribbon domain-containing protein [Pseudomonas putida]MDD1964604.1 zinc-ribbon domain-containing protein [Pseudomonas putida]
MAAIKQSFLDAYPRLSKRLDPTVDPSAVARNSHERLRFECMGVSCGNFVERIIYNLARTGDASLIYCDKESCQKERREKLPPRTGKNFQSLLEYRPQLADQLYDAHLAATTSRKSKAQLVFRCRSCNKPNIVCSPLSIKDDEYALFCEETVCRAAYKTNKKTVSSGRQSYAKLAGPGKSLKDKYPNLAAKQHATCMVDLATVKPKSNRYGIFSCDGCSGPVRRQLQSATKDSELYCADHECVTLRKAHSMRKNWATRIAKRGNLAEVNPNIANQWQVCPKYPSLRPADVPPNSRLQVLWQCPLHPDHSWKRSIDARMTNPGCPLCNSNISRMQLRFASEIEGLLGVVVKHSKKYDIDGAKIEIDISFENNNKKIAIEVDGFRWHETKLEADKIKDTKLQAAGWLVIRFRDDRLQALSTSDKVVQVSGNGFYEKQWRISIAEVVTFIAAKTGTEVSINLNEYNKYLFNDKYIELCEKYRVP